jgi:hypothetical protein
MTDLRFDELDADDALGEALEDMTGISRAGLLKGALVGSGALLAAVALPSPALAKTAAGDVSILNFALLLEELQAVFYTEVERNKVLHGALAEQARIVGTHERAHVQALRKALGSKAAKRPFFDFGNAVESPAAFRRTAVAFEDLAVAAYKGQAPHLKSKEILAAALAIHSVEARHAAWIRRLAGKPPAANAFDDAKSRSAVTQLVASTKFVMTTRSKKRPRFTG